MTDSRRIVLASRPSGMCDGDTVRTERVPIPEPAEGEAVVRVQWLSIDPTIRTWMDDAPGYLPPIEVGAVIRSGGIGTVEVSKNVDYPVGTTVFGMLGWQDRVLVGGSHGSAQVVPDGVGFDAAINYKTDPVKMRLHELCPDGINVYFDNVGGAILDACLGQLAMKGRVVCCGAISAYNDREHSPGLTNYFNLITKRARMEGFLILDHIDRFPGAQADMLGWVLEGKVKHAVHVVDGLEEAPNALNLLFTGGNTGKVMVQVET